MHGHLNVKKEKYGTVSTESEFLRSWHLIPKLANDIL